MVAGQATSYRMTKILKIIVLSCVTVLLFNYYLIPTYSYSCEDSCDNLDDTTKQTCLNEVTNACKAKINETNVAKKTLQSAISYYDGKIKLTQTQVNQTAFEISQLEKEINSLEGNISNLDLQLDKIGESLTARIRESYISGQINKMYLFIGSDGLTNLISRLKYLKITQNHDRKSMVLLEQARANYDAQKIAKETKQAHVLDLQADLLSQKQTLGKQQQEKEYLLVVTKHDESRYQQLLSDAAAQLTAFSRFVTNQGGASILSNQTKCDGWGCYYNQRDSQWGNMGLGGSAYTVAKYGCLVSSVAMVGSHYGKSFKPGDIAGNSSAFVPGQGYLYHDFDVSGSHITITNASKSLLDSELSAGRPVIAGLYSGPDHFIVIIKKEGDNYIMHDPFLENGSNRPLTDKYSVSDINSLRLVSFN